MSKVHPTRIFLVDDHPVVRNGLRTHLERGKDVAIVGEASTAEKALEQLTETKVDLVIVDIGLDGMDGIELTQRLAGGKDGHESSGQESPLVLIVSMHDGTPFVESALEAGARGYVLKNNAHAVLDEAVRAVLDGETYLDPKAKERLSR